MSKKSTILQIFKPRTLVLHLLPILTLLIVLAFYQDQTNLLPFEKKNILSALLILLGGALIYTFVKYHQLYKSISQLFAKMISLNLISEESHFIVYNNKKIVWFTNDQELIDYVNQHSLLYHQTGSFTYKSNIITIRDISELTQELRYNLGKNITLLKLDKIIPTHLQSAIDHLEQPVYVCDQKENIIFTNQSLQQSILACQEQEIPEYNTLSQEVFNNHITLTHHRKVIGNFTRTAIIHHGKLTFYTITRIYPGQSYQDLLLDDNYPIAAFTLNHNEQIVSFNLALKKLLNNSAFNNKKLSDLIDQNSAEKIRAYLKNAEKNKIVVTEIKFLTPDIIVILYLIYIPDRDSYLCQAFDITSYKNTEMHLVHSQKMQAIGQLAGGIAHDFNNLLTAMIGFCDLLLIRHPAGDPSFADIMQIKQNSNRAANLVRQLLAISRKQVLRLQVLNITDVIAELASLIRRLVGTNVKLKTNYGREQMLIKADQGQIEQVIMNLAVNAKDAIGDKPGTITISTNVVEVKNSSNLDPALIIPSVNEPIIPGKYVVIEVNDTGTGIPTQIVNKIFEPFFSTKEIGAGTGLGLSTVYGIVKQNGGYIYLKSKKDVGTSFFIYLKAHNEQEIEEKSTPNEPDNKSTQQDLTGNATILLVEDEAPVRMFSNHALTNKGYHIIEAENAQQGLAIVKEKGDEINLIISDVIMPGMNGPTMVKEIHKTKPNIKVIFMSGYAQEAFSQTYGVEGDFHFLAKPFTLKELASKVKEVLDDDNQ